MTGRECDREVAVESGTEEGREGGEGCMGGRRERGKRRTKGDNK